VEVDGDTEQRQARHQQAGDGAGALVVGDAAVEQDDLRDRQVGGLGLGLGQGVVSDTVETDTYRVGEDALLTDENGESGAISMEDYAVAVLDEAGNGNLYLQVVPTKLLPLKAGKGFMTLEAGELK